MLRTFWIALYAALFAGVAFAQTAPPAQSGPKITARQVAPATARSTITILVNKTEPGEPMSITGRVTDGTKPIKNASVFVYHTDAEGYYANHRVDNGDDARLNGAMRTDAEGRYAYRTIRPASYAGSRFPAHVHTVVHADGYQDLVTEFNFDDDPFMNDPGQREFNASRHRGIVKMTKDGAGVWHGVFDITLTKAD